MEFDIQEVQKSHPLGGYLQENFQICVYIFLIQVTEKYQVREERHNTWTRRICIFDVKSSVCHRHTDGFTSNIHSVYT